MSALSIMGPLWKLLTGWQRIALEIHHLIRRKKKKKSAKLWSQSKMIYNTWRQNISESGKMWKWRFKHWDTLSHYSNTSSFVPLLIWYNSFPPHWTRHCHCGLEFECPASHSSQWTRWVGDLCVFSHSSSICVTTWTLKMSFTWFCCEAQLLSKLTDCTFAVCTVDNGSATQSCCHAHNFMAL